MRLSFPAEQQALRDEFERVYSAEASPERARKAAASDIGWDSTLWTQLADLGWLGATVDERHGGLGQDSLLLCLLAESAGRRLAAIPFASAAIGFAEALRILGGEVADSLLPGCVSGEVIGGIVPRESWDALEIVDGKAAGVAPAVMDGSALTHVLTLAGDGEGAELAVVSLAGTAREQVDSLDAVNLARALRLDGQVARIAARGGTAVQLWSRIVDRYAVLLAFAQVGGAETALRGVCDHVAQRYAFGRPLGSFQSIKHGLADVLAAIELARSNAWYAAATVVDDSPELPAAAAAARVSATEAHRQAARAMVHYMGGLGVTEECDAHLHYRKAQALGMVIGGPDRWREQLLTWELAHRVGSSA